MHDKLEESIQRAMEFGKKNANCIMGQPDPIGFGSPFLVKPKKIEECKVEKSEDDDAIPDKEEEKKPLATYTYSTFGGCDCSMSVDSVRAFELQSISFAQTWDPHLKVWAGAGSMIFMMFGDDPVEKYFGDNGDTEHLVHLYFANEYGSCSSMAFEGVRVYQKAWGLSVDDMVSEMTITFTFTKLYPMQKVDCHIKECDNANDETKECSGPEDGQED